MELPTTKPIAKLESKKARANHLLFLTVLLDTLNGNPFLCNLKPTHHAEEKSIFGRML